MEDKKTDIYNYGKELFSSKGFKDTNVADITKKAGVSVGTFYNYYSSKEKLFMDIFIDENVKLKKNMMSSVNIEDTPLDFIKGFLSMNIAGMKSNPILKEWYNHDVFNKIEKLFRQENGNDSVSFIYGNSLEMVTKWQAEGKMRSDLSSELIMTIFAALVNIDTHKEEVGLQHFPQVLDLITEFVIKGLMDTVE
ncbi:TetR/AcrR family transcriptional regulator [Anaerocolumna sp. MB42-C2]|uniref:TetR/AcrR family transcriptional regulator n=1 Tax=Anaerocolumna sp. MB42-C2 TaxID=3070997 RepID=UPI0027E07EE2|nr:TetR/AcrR family transcriptional regulator [Anaerocolumna sp. MB42-C2]WMJ90298.1 TetR/AcrR family transcriptional regulator [Anaerocolumna sp. MB42-C2]